MEFAPFPLCCFTAAHTPTWRGDIEILITLFRQPDHKTKATHPQ